MTLKGVCSGDGAILIRNNFITGMVESSSEDHYAQISKLKQTGIMNAREAKTKLQEEVRKSGMTRKKWYRKIYLKSDHWLQLKNALFITRGRFCERCKSILRLDVHHKEYRSIFDVTINDLEILCRKCHCKEHRKTRNKKKIEKKRKPRQYRSPKRILNNLIKELKKEMQREIETQIVVNQLLLCHKKNS